MTEGEPENITHPRTRPEVASIFDLGDSGGSNIARDKDAMIAEAFDSLVRKA
jgi:hypothetical protein